MLLLRVGKNPRPLRMPEKGWNRPTFRYQYNIRWTLGGNYSVIRLNDGRRLVIRKDQSDLPYNAEATAILHNLTLQTDKVVNGTAVFCTMEELGPIHTKNKWTEYERTVERASVGG